MKHGLVAVSAAVAFGALVGGVTGCQLLPGPGSQVQEIAAKSLTPDLMLLVDRSESMDLPADPSAPSCQTNNGPCGQTKSALCDVNPSSAAYCPTRWTELQSAASDFLAGAGASARMGLAVFPDISQGGTGQSLCGLSSDTSSAPGEITRVDIVSSDAPADLQAQAEAIKQSLLAITSANVSDLQNVTTGGAPVSLGLRSLASNARLLERARDNYVILLTDGAPNCNPDNVSTWSDAACRCTLATCDASTGRLGCLDKTAAVTQIITLRTKGIKTIVVGVGADVTSGDALSSLNAMAQAGGVARECPDGTDAACGPGNTCIASSKLCSTAFYTAADHTQLAAVLNSLGAKVTTDALCTLALASKPTDSQKLQVDIDGADTPSGADTWRYDSVRNVITLQGALCARAQGVGGAAAPQVKVFQGK